MIEIIATAAVSGLLTGTAIGFSLARPWQDWTIKRDIERDLVRNRLRKSNEELRLEIATLQHNSAIDLDAEKAHRKAIDKIAADALADRDHWHVECLELREKLEASGKPDKQAVSDYMREIGARGNASQKRAKKAVPDADGWIGWSGGRRPVDGDTPVIYEMRDGHKDSISRPARNLRWNHDGTAGDIIAYRIVSAEQREAA